jgi:ATP-binding protein involved in chromosome partitioning
MADDGEDLEPEFTPSPQHGMAQQAEEALAGIDRVLVVMSGKGGVGKSTVAVNLAAALDGAGLDVGLADFDITNPNTPRMTGLEGFQFEGSGPFEPPESEGVPVASAAFFKPPEKSLAWRGPLKQKMISSLLGRVDWPDLDVLVLDLPPGTSDEPLSVSELVPTEKTRAVLVTTPQTVSTEDVALNFRFAVTVEIPVVGIVENMSPFECECGREHAIFGEGGGRRLAQELDVPLLAEVPIDSRLREAGDAGRPLVVDGPDAASARALAGAAERLIDLFDVEAPAEA